MSLTGRGGKLVFGNTKETLYIDEGASPSTSDDVILGGYPTGQDELRPVVHSKSASVGREVWSSSA